MSDPFDPVNMAMRNLHNQNLLAAKDARIRQLEERLETMLDAIERTGGLDNIRRVEVSQPVVIDMARENARLKAEVERLTSEVSYDNRVQLHVDKLAGEFTQAEVERLKAEVERLRKHGDAMAEALEAAGFTTARDFWNAAKEGKGQP